MKNRFFAITIFAGLTLSIRAAEIPNAVIPAGVGVNIHFVTGHERDLDLIAAAGFKFIRMDFGWASIERKKGEYNWSEYDQLLAHLDDEQMRALFILDYSNPLYEGTVTSTNPISHVLHKNTASPQHPESVAAFARWAAAAAKHYHGRHVIWEIWNEPNIQFWSPKPDAQQYATLALATCKAIRETEPQATIIGPASSEFPWPFLETFLKAGVLEYLDAVSVHPYRNPGRPPETAAADYEKLRQLIGQYAPANRAKVFPILSGEWGYSSNAKGLPVDKQAAFAVRQQLSNLLQGIPLSIWYDWKNDGSDPNENEHNFGTVLPDLTPKPAYIAIKTMTHELSGYRIAQRLKLESDKDYALICQNTMGSKKVVAWTTGESHLVTLDLPIKDAKVSSGTTMNGDRFTPTVSAGKLTLELGIAPKYVNVAADVSPR
jgi:hypothetical protein